MHFHYRLTSTQNKKFYVNIMFPMVKLDTNYGFHELFLNCKKNPQISNLSAQDAFLVYSSSGKNFKTNHKLLFKFKMFCIIRSISNFLNIFHIKGKFSKILSRLISKLLLSTKGRIECIFTL